VETVLDGARVVVALEAVANADNVGGVFRNAAAFGADAVLLSPSCCDPLYRKAIRTSMAATLQVPFARMADWPGRARGPRGSRFHDRGADATRIGAITRPLRRHAPGRVALLIGNEGLGLSREAEEAAQHLVRVPICRPSIP
jgi:tRNA G18 (ribose-2'-O)-methylase SpoU